jgi:hypothetical protein
MNGASCAALRLPLVLLCALAQGVLERVLCVSIAPVEAVLDGVSADLERRGLPQDALDDARLNLAQAELARRALVRRVPAVIAVLGLVSGVVLAVAAAARPRSAVDARQISQASLRPRWRASCSPVIDPVARAGLPPSRASRAAVTCFATLLQQTRAGALSTHVGAEQGAA